MKNLLEALKEEIQNEIDLEGNLRLALKESSSSLSLTFFEEKEEGQKEKVGSIRFELDVDFGWDLWAQVSPEYRGKSVGRALVKAGIKLLSEKENLRTPLLKAQVTPDESRENEGLGFGQLRSFYESLGFEVTKESPAPMEGGFAYLDIQMKL